MSLDQLEEIKVAIGYEVEGERLEGFPADLDILAKVKVQYRTFPGWKKDISKTTSFAALPRECKEYIQFIEEFTGVLIGWIGVGPGRESMISR